MAQYITLADGTKIEVPRAGDVDSGYDFDFQGALNNAGYVSLPGAGALDFFRDTYGANFSTPEQYLQWVYGGGNLENTSQGQYFKTPSGVDSFANNPLSYDPQGFEFGDAVLMGIMAGAGAGLTGLLPGTTNVFSGITGGMNFSNPFSGVTNLFGGGENALSGMDLSGYMAGVDAGPGFLEPTLTSGVEGAVGGGTSSLGNLGAQQAIDGSMQSIYDAYANAGVPGYSTALTSGVAAGGAAGSSLANMGSGVLGGLKGFIKDYGSILGPAISGGMGYLGASKQADMNKDMFNQYFGLGAPYRDLLLKSYQPGFDVAKEPGFSNAMDTTLDTYMRAASAGRASGVSSGNPWESPGAMMESQKYLLGNLALPYLQNYRSGLSSAGQLGLGPSASFGAGQIQAEGGKYDAVGYGLNEILNPRPKYGITLDPKTGQFKLGGLV